MVRIVEHLLEIVGRDCQHEVERRSIAFALPCRALVIVDHRRREEAGHSFGELEAHPGAYGLCRAVGEEADDSRSSIRGRAPAVRSCARRGR